MYLHTYMESQTPVVVSESSSQPYSIFDRLDEEQIRNADKAVKQKMVYRYKNKDELTYSGIKFIILEMSRHDEVVEIEASETRLEKDVEDDMNYWFWRSEVKLRNSKTQYPSIGMAECKYLDEDGKYNPFARQTSNSKAERNAQRKQIPEQRIIELLKIVKDEDIQVVDEDNQETIRLCQCGDTCQPNKFITKCVGCNGAINEYMRSQLKQKDSDNSS